MANIILYGGDGSESPQIRRLSMNIYRSFTKEGFQKEVSKYVFDALRNDSCDLKNNSGGNEFDEILQENATQVKDNVRVAEPWH